MVTVNRYRVAFCIDGSDKAHNVVEANAHMADAVQLLGPNTDNNRIWFQSSQLHVSSLMRVGAVSGLCISTHCHDGESNTHHYASPIQWVDLCNLGSGTRFHQRQPSQ